jgi:hypothetical protein
MVHDNIPDERNIRYAEQNWDTALAFTDGSNTHTLFTALLSAYDSVDDDIESLYKQTHINSATGAELDQFGELVNVERKSNESDAKYRARIKATFRSSTMGATFDQFSEFVAVVLETDIDNIRFLTPYERKPATVEVSANSEIYEALDLTNEDVIELLDGGVPAGHRVEVFEGGTFRLKSDGDGDDPQKGLTSDSIETGGTVRADLEE